MAPLPAAKVKTGSQLGPGNDFIQGIANLFSAKPSTASATLPKAPNLSTDTGGITGPGATSPQTVTESGQGVVDAATATAEGQLAAGTQDKADLTAIAEGAQADAAETAGLIDTERADLQKAEETFQTNLDTAGETISAIPAEITNEFNRLREEFGAVADASFDRIDGQRGEALAKADQGQGLAMQAAVQGIQGNVNSSVAQIQANPNLSAGQKSSMISQVRLQGASSMAPAIGATVLGFATLSADIATKFGNITGQLESTILQGEAQLAGLQGQAFSQAQIAVGQMTNQLLEIDANSTVAFTNSQSQLLAARSHAEMTGNDIALRATAEMGTPYLDLTGAATAAYEVNRDNMFTQWEIDMQSAGFEMQRALIESMQGSPISNMFQGFIGGISGPGGNLLTGLAGGIGGFLGSQ